MSLEDLPGEVRIRLTYFDTESDNWSTVADDMGTTYRNLYYGERIPPFSERIPLNLRSFGEKANEAFDVYIEVLNEGVRRARAVSDTLHAAGKNYMLSEGYNEELANQIQRELDK